MIIAVSRVHYGKDYLASVIQSALPYVDKFVVLYTPVPTFGRFTDMPCPDSREALYNIALAVGGKKMDWREGVPTLPDTVWHLYPQANIVLELDADEIIEPQLFEGILTDYEAGKLDQFCYRLPFLHHWRSFNYVCKDAGWPARLYLPKYPRAEAHYYDNPSGYIHHFGYARNRYDTEYKWQTSTHIGELRPEWWTEVWDKFPERLTDIHPVSRDFWNAEPYDKCKLPVFMHNHVYFDREVID